MRLAMVGLFRAKWTTTIHDEWMRNLLANRPDLNAAKLQRTRELMDASVLDCLVTGYEDLIAGLSLPDPNDRHVLAAAIRSGSDAIITFNLTDFPDSVLKPYGIEAQHPDDFIVCQLDLAPGLVVRALKEQHQSLRNPSVSVDQFLERLKAQHLTQTVARLRSDHFAELL